jgi:O-methyltransferase involved in polyketide biosynthesis
MSWTQDTLIDGGLQQTAWLTAGCHVSAGAAWALHRPVSTWLIGRFGMPPFTDRLKYFTVHGIAQRAAAIDRLLDARLHEWDANGERYEVWSLGAGFDSRWYSLGRLPGLRRYLEFDLPDLLTRKRALLDASPYAQHYARVISMPGEVQETVASAVPEKGNRLMVVIEGMIDYLDEIEKRRLLADLATKQSECEIIVDVQNGHLTRHNNRRAERATGTPAVRFAPAPENPEHFYTSDTGFQIHSTEALFPDLFKARFPRLGRLLPLPQRVRRSYLLLHLVQAQ